MPRPARPDDLYRLAVPFDPRLSPDGRIVAFTVKRSRRRARRLPARDLARADRRLGAGPARHDRRRTDRHPRFSPDGRTLAFISDRRLLVEEEPDRPKEAKDRQDCDQVHLLPLDGGEARRLTDLPRGVNDFAWSPDGRYARGPDELARRHRATRSARKRGRPAPPKPGETPLSDYRYIDRLGYQYNGAGLHRRPRHPPVARRRGDARRGPLAGRRSDGRGRARLVARRHPDRVRGQPPAEPGPRLAVVGVRRRRGDGRGHDDRRRARRRCSSAPPGPPTARRSSRSATASRAPATGPGSGASPPTARTPAGAAARTCSRAASSSRRRD